LLLAFQEVGTKLLLEPRTPFCPRFRAFRISVMRLAGHLSILPLASLYHGA
jgi:hypothetical protein